MHSEDFQRGFASEWGLSLQKKLIWHTNVNLRSFEVCPSLLKNASHTTDKCKHRRSCSPSLLNSDLHLQENQAEHHELGNAIHLQRGITVPGLWAESCHSSRSQVPTSTTPHSCPHHTHSLGLEPFQRSIWLSKGNWLSGALMYQMWDPSTSLWRSARIIVTSVHKIAQRLSTLCSPWPQILCAGLGSLFQLAKWLI